MAGLLAALLVGCKKPDEKPAGTDATAAPAAPAPAAGSNEVGRRLDLIEQLPRCEVRHRGVLIDLGSPASEGLSGWRLGPETQTVVEREGANWLRVTARNLSYRFTLDEPQQVFVAARIKSLGSKSVAVTIDGKVVATLGLTRGQTRLVASAPLSAPLGAGMHVLGLRFAGVSKEGVDPVAEVDWVRVGFPDDDTSSFAAPTASDILQNLATFGEVPHRSLALRTPSSVRCAVTVPANARLRVSTALVGSGEGEAEIRVLTDGQPAEVLKTIRMLGAEKPPWTDLDLPLERLAGKQVVLEMAAAQGGRGSRMLFGDPRILAPSEGVPQAPKAKAVIVAVVSSIHPTRLPPWAPDRPLPTFDALAREGTLFERYRSPTTVVGGVMSTLLTGLHPRQHGVEDGFARLPESLPTLATVARDASVHTAMFTAHPGSFEAFGFARGWDRFLAHSPVSPATGTRPLDDLIAWLGERGANAKGLLAVVHTRGMHPPFDLSPGEFAQLPPHPEREYAGPLDPRRAGQVLTRFRPRKRGQPQKWTETDALRLNAMMDLALVQTDRSLSNLIDALRKAGLWNDTLLVVTSEVAAGEETPLPFAEVIEPSEEALRVPLYVKFPGGAHAGERVGAPAQAVDITATALESLGLGAAAAAAGGESLYRLAERGMLASERMQVATLGERSFVRWGDWRLVARDGAAPQLCELGSDPKCEHDVAERWPSVVQAMWRAAYDHEAQARPPRWQKPRREPATLDTDMAAAMAVWGR